MESMTLAIEPDRSRLENTRMCSSCRTAQDVDDFDYIADTHKRRSNCRGCVAEMDRRLRAGIAVYRIARTLHIDDKVVARRRDELGIRGRRHARNVDTGAIIALHRSRHTIKQIAEQLAVSEKTVLRHLPRETRSPRRGKPGDFAGRIERARLLLEDGCTYAEAARTVDISEDTLASRLPGFGSTNEHRSVFASINNSPALRDLHREIMAIAV